MSALDGVFGKWLITRGLPPQIYKYERVQLLCVCDSEEFCVNNQNSLQELKYQIRRETVSISRQDLHRLREIRRFSTDARSWKSEFRDCYETE